MNDETRQVVKKGQDIELTIESLAFGGKGVAKVDGFTVFVERVLSGQKVVARVYKKRKSYAEAYPIKIIEKAKNEIDAICPAFGVCGGCRIQNLEYEDQLIEKTQQVRDLIQRVGGFTNFELSKALPSPQAFHYRNKMEFTFSDSPWRDHPEDTPEPLGLGQHIPGRYDKIIHLETCYLQKAVMNDIMNFVFKYAIERKWQAYNTKTHEGWARNLILRYGEHTDQIMVNIVTKSYDEIEILPLRDQLVEAFPQITTIVNNITSRRAGVSVGEEEFVLFGPGVIKDRLGEYEFEISANSFFQTNTRQAEQLYAETLKAAGIKADDIVYDLYCGTGTISLFLAKQAKKVYGFELVEDAIKNAQKNALDHHVTNVEFIQGDLKDVLSKQLDEIEAADVIVVDPPRAGLHQNVVDDILRVAPEKLVYVSCNPSTLARDLKLFCAEKYDLISVQPVDMFPHTTHIESVANLVLKG
jgi:23S rRNA (uracil1939-C5)-methyltransferase